MREFDTRGCL